MLLEGNGTGTCAGGWQFVYSGVTGGQTYRLRTHARHREVANVRDSLLAVALWGKWDPATERTGTIPYNYLLPNSASPNETDFESVVTAPEGVKELTIRYVFRWTAKGTSTWSVPQIEPATAAERKPVKVCVVSDGTKMGLKTKHPMSIQGLGLAPEVEKSINLWAGLILDACDRRPQFILTPETIIGGPKPLENAVTVPGPATRPFEQIAREHHVHLMLGVYERAGGARHNSTVLISPEGKVVGVYRKAHLATSEGWSGLTPGNSLLVFSTNIGRIGSIICMDTMLPESSRMLTLNGADIIAWNEGDKSIIEATLPTEEVRYWDGGDVGETTFLLRRPHLYSTSTDDAVLGPLTAAMNAEAAKAKHKTATLGETFRV